MYGGEVRMTRTRSDFIQAVIDKMIEAGVEVTLHNDGLTVRRNGALLKPVEFTTDVYPGFPTDLQAPFMALIIGIIASVVTTLILGAIFNYSGGGGISWWYWIVSAIVAAIGITIYGRVADKSV